MDRVYALALIYGMTTEQEILDLYDDDYLQNVLRIKNEILEEM